MAEFQWWLLLVGLVAGGGLVAVVSMDSRRREQDIGELEQRAEATWIADQLAGRGSPDAATVEAVLRAHREYLTLQPPDRLIVDQDEDLGAFALDRLDGDRLDSDPDRQPDHVGDDGRGRADEDLAHSAEQQATTRQEAHAGADREQGGDR
jgi:bifunctional DNA-binding transcriptional regulator/antitoxin component of YhaV-PrlF toxin-antitoxin module